MNLHVGLVSFGGGVFRYDIPQGYLDETINRLKDADIDLKTIDKIVIDDESSDKAIETFKNAQIDVLIIQFGTFSMGNNLVKFIKEFEDVPFFVWGFNDPIVDDFPTIPMNSLTVFNMFTSFLYKFNKKFDYAYASFSDDSPWEKLDIMLNTLRAKKQLKYSKYAIVGSRVPGFYLSMVDELRFRKEIGPEIMYYSIGTWIDEANKVKKSRVDEALEKLYIDVKVNIKDEVVEKNMRLELAILDYIEANNITAVTIKCWPELQSLYGCSACGILSRLNDRGIVASCEGDLAGLATMDILHKLSKKTIFFADPVAVTEEGALKVWHCGLGPTELAADKNEVEFIHQATMRGDIGMGVQYTMKTGRVTLCKLSEGRENYRMFYATGNTINPDRKVLGVQTDVVLDAGFDNMLKTVVENGIEHHYAVVHEDMTSKIESFCKWLNIKALGI